jgi:hypothetical protein
VIASPLRLVLRAVEAHPGLRSSQLGDLLKDQVTSSAKNPRKLILNAVGYLASRGAVEKAASGGWVVASATGATTGA